jgi:hypothetical protein
MWIFISNSFNKYKDVVHMCWFAWDIIKQKKPKFKNIFVSHFDKHTFYVTYTFQI